MHAYIMTIRVGAPVNLGSYVYQTETSQGTTPTSERERACFSPPTPHVIESESESSGLPHSSLSLEQDEPIDVLACHSPPAATEPVHHIMFALHRTLVLAQRDSKPNEGG
jgi:hypothetical protein